MNNVSSEEDKFKNLLDGLRSAANECWQARIALLQVNQKHARLCIDLLLATCQIPKLQNNKIEERKAKTGLDPIHPDFWNDDMIIALAEHYKLMGNTNASP